MTDWTQTRNTNWPARRRGERDADLPAEAEKLRNLVIDHAKSLVRVAERLDDPATKRRAAASLRKLASEIESSGVADAAIGDQRAFSYELDITDPNDPVFRRVTFPDTNLREINARGTWKNPAKELAETAESLAEYDVREEFRAALEPWLWRGRNA